MGGGAPSEYSSAMGSAAAAGPAVTVAINIAWPASGPSCFLQQAGHCYKHSTLQGEPDPASEGATAGCGAGVPPTHRYPTAGEMPSAHPSLAPLTLGQVAVRGGTRSVPAHAEQVPGRLAGCLLRPALARQGHCRQGAALPRLLSLPVLHPSGLLLHLVCLVLQQGMPGGRLTSVLTMEGGIDEAASR